MRVARALYRFNTQPLEGGCALTNSDKAHSYGFNTQPLEGGCQQKRITTVVIEVSTHSRPKAAAGISKGINRLINGFNTQPPEGGCELENIVGL